MDPAILLAKLHHVHDLMAIDHAYEADQALTELIELARTDLEARSSARF